MNTEELLTLANGNQKPRTVKQMHKLGILRDGALAIREDRIVVVGKTRDSTKAFKAEYLISAKGKLVLLGFVDPHACMHSMHAEAFLRRMLQACINKPIFLVDKGPWYPEAFQALGLEWEHRTFGERNRIERWFSTMRQGQGGSSTTSQ